MKWTLLMFHGLPDFEPTTPPRGRSNTIPGDHVTSNSHSLRFSITYCVIDPHD